MNSLTIGVDADDGFVLFFVGFLCLAALALFVVGRCRRGHGFPGLVRLGVGFARFDVKSTFCVERVSARVVFH